MTAIELVNEELERIHDALESTSINNWSAQDLLIKEHARLINAVISFIERENKT